MRISFCKKVAFDPATHNQVVDMNDPWVRPHIHAFMRGGGSTSENIVRAFVFDNYKMIPACYTIRRAWQRLDNRQCELVKALRLELNRGDGFPSNDWEMQQFLFDEMCSRVYSEMHTEWVEQHGHDYIPFIEQHEMAKKSAAIVKEAVTHPDEVPFDMPYTIEYDEDYE
ncbi:hypothetical protein [Vibrio sp. WXL103]|uniref:hypothetical protein n=1 Tax=Vibrio sp. WXL103 TaxID=3450710 RepID=UPI003EC82892